jgi:alkanesulfonate monooxygenase SsuD/methylene tetrahydromethanopterin reductase-like flavin-dependent oxidoreductase (luciferase family)
VILGVGTGWIEEELRCLGASWEERGAMLDEAIDVMRLLWRREGPLSFHGKYVRFSDVLFYPKPAKKGGPPIWIGGKREPSLRRAAERGDGWIPWAVSPRELEEGSRRIRTLSGGRDIEVACLIPVDIGGKRTGYLGTLGERHHILAGSLDKISSTIEDFSEAGLDHLICSFRDIRLFKDEKIDEINNQMRIFAREIIPSFK